MRISVGSTPCTEEHIGPKRSISITDDLRELPCKKFLVSPEDKENSHILAEAVSQPHSEAAWRFTGFYGEPETHRRHESWDLLRRLNQQSSLPWLCAGDFNEIVKKSVKVRGRVKPQGQMQLFREVLDECGFMDIGFKGSPFTWSKHYSSGVSIWEWLDLAVVSYDWFVRYPRTRVNHVDSTTSDHKLLCIEHAELDLLPKKKLFRFEEMWLGDKGCGETVEGVWQVCYEEVDSTRVIKKVEKCGQALTDWSRECFGNIWTELEKKRRKLVWAEKLFSSSNPEDAVDDLDSIPQIVTGEMNDSLTGEFQAWEIESALKQMAPLKAPGPDGMLPLFYQNFWELVRVLANRLKRVLPNIISEHQSAFIKGHLITDNILVAYETLHYMKNHNSRNSGYMALKLNMSKAYNRVEWSFLRDVMIKMGFSDRWVALVMECVTIVTYSLLINGEPFGDIKPSRGIRQGDPLSPYLFLLCSEGLHRMIKKATEKGEIQEYLGLPALVGRNKRASFDQLKQKVWKRLQGWESKLLSQAGREVLIKSVIQAIPTFTMSCFKLPTTLCHEIETLIRKFWWGQKGERRKVHWVKWGDLCQDKDQGGMGFKDLTMFNEAMLVKLAWRLLHNDNSLFSRVFNARFFLRGTILETKDSSSASYAWKSILKGRDVILKGAIWRIGDGKRVRIWGDNWLPSKTIDKVATPVLFGQESSNVEVLINQRTRSRRNNVIDHVFNSQEVEIIKSIPLSLTTQLNVLIWPFTPSGSYSIKSGYHFLQENFAQSQSAGQDTEFWEKVWSMEVPSKIKNFVWQASKDALPVKMNLLRRKISQDGQCDICKAGDEDCLHALFFCSEIQAMWSADPQWKWFMEMQACNIKEIFKRADSEKWDAELMAYTRWDRKVEFQRLHPATVTQQHRNHTRWKPPKQGYYKVNYDGAVSSQMGKAGLGVIIRNCERAVMASMAQQIPLPTTVAQVEALAA
ncbi:uncharacterized protein LOC142624873 [Castanea sativa]|uniref:uncharacterized protein LOC142624873 n=1 Tax=Castanea sativa TaxID=21020 RepID=UPI003F65122D